MAGRLEAMEERLARLETLLVGLTQQLEHQRTDPTKVVASIQTWVTDYVSMRLQQLVPETCEHAPEPEASDGPYLPGPPCHVLTMWCTVWGVSLSPLCARWSLKKSPSRHSTNTLPVWMSPFLNVLQPSDSANCQGGSPELAALATARPGGSAAR